MRKLVLRLIAVVLPLVVVSVAPAGGQDKKAPDSDKASIWMKKKREFAQNILAGLTEADFDKISTNAKAMNALGYFEQWARADQPEYKRQVTYFDFANQQLIRHARDKNLEGVTLSYNLLVISCVHCHQIVRDTKK